MDKRTKIFLVSFILSLPSWWLINFVQKNLENYFFAQISQPYQEMVLVGIPEKIRKPKLELEAESVISIKVTKVGRERIPFQKNPEEILPIASLTKLMTAVIVLDSNPPTILPARDGAPKHYDLKNTWITISPEAANQVNVPNYGNLDKEIGKKFNLKQLLDLMLIYSSNDAAWALAEVIEIPNFVEKMNQKAKELGFKNTNFVNPTGLDPENLYFHPPNREYFNYSTAQDLAKLAQYILENHPIIFEITLKKGPYLVENGLSDLIWPENFTLRGGKTGYTDEAGGCLLTVLIDERGSLFFNIILGTPARQERISQMQKLIDWLNPAIHQ